MPNPGKQQPAHIETQIPVRFDYLLYLPTDYEQRDAWPLLLFLHGIDERGTDVANVARFGPPKQIADGRHFPMIVVSPQCPPRQGWEPLELTAFLDAVIPRYRVDLDCIYVTGLSMGGFGTWSLAANTPRRFAAIVPICGGGEANWARRLRHLPIWTFHGAKDDRVPLERSQQMVDALRRHGSDVRFTIYPETGHDAWTETYNNPEVYDWLLEQRRTED